MILTIKGISKKGKNRVHENGNKWKVIIEQDYDISKNYGPWLYIEPLDNKENSRWIHKTNDKDFEIISKEEVLV